MKVLITGAGGFVGRVLTSLLASSDHHVTGVDLGNRIEGVHDWIKVELDKPLDTSILPRDTEAIIHLAQSPAYRLGAQGEEQVFETNVAMHSKLLRYASEVGVSQFTSASTGTVYEPFTHGMKESDLVSPTGFYGASKYAAEVLANSYRDRFNVCNIRPFFVYGPGQKDMLIARLISSISLGDTVNLPLEGKGLLFVPTYVDDVARCFKESIENNWRGAINVASPNTASFQTVLETISTALEKNLNLVRKGDSPKTPIIPELAKLGALTDLSKFVSLEEGIKLTVQAHLASND